MSIRPISANKVNQPTQKAVQMIYVVCRCSRIRNRAAWRQGSAHEMKTAYGWVYRADFAAARRCDEAMATFNEVLSLAPEDWDGVYKVETER